MSIYVHDLGHAFAEIAARRAGLPTIRNFPNRDISYRERDALTNRLAHLLLARGIGAGHVIALQNGESPEG
jgi:non-ribosomal peptide synthetase component F